MANSKSLMNYTMPLSQAVKDAPNAAGCYQIYLGDELVYVGKAGDGIRKRFVQYYNGTTAHYPSAEKIYENKDLLSVKWKIVENPSMVAEQEAKWIRTYKPTWNHQSGWGDKGVLTSVTSAKPVGESSNRIVTGTTNTGMKSTPVDMGKATSVAGNMVKGAAISAGITAGVEIAKGVYYGEPLGTCTEHVVSKGMESAASGAGGIVGAEIGSVFGPVGTAVGYLIGSKIAGELVDGAFDEVGFQAGIMAEEISDKVEDIVFDTSVTLDCLMDEIRYNPVVEAADALRESISDGIGSAWFDIKLGLGWF